LIRRRGTTANRPRRRPPPHEGPAERERARSELQSPPTSPAPKGPARRERALFELQIHPGDIRRRVRYLFVGRRRLVRWTLAAAAWLVLVGFAAAVSPEVFSGLRARRELPRLDAERQRQGDRLRAMVARLDELSARGEELRLRVDKARLAYGLNDERSIGQGGFPFEPRPAPRSIFANVIESGRGQEAGLREQIAVLGAFLDEVQALEHANRELTLRTPSTNPLKGTNFYLTSPFGNRRSPFTKLIDFHAGIDLAAPMGKSIHAPADGVVVFAGRYPQRQSVAWWRYGNLVVLRHGEDFITLFGHCDEVVVKRGQRVRQGEPLATVGDTGWSTSPHLHYEVRRREEDGDFRPVDPRIYILDHRWRDEERILVRARSAPPLDGYEPLPRLLAR